MGSYLFFVSVWLSLLYLKHFVSTCIPSSPVYNILFVNISCLQTQPAVKVSAFFTYNNKHLKSYIYYFEFWEDEIEEAEL